MSTYLVATGNAHKLSEISEILGSDFELRDMSEVPEVGEIIEDGDSFAANAAIKALALSAHTSLPVIADDSGLEVDALNGEPGIYSARYAGANASDAENRDKLLDELKTKAPDLEKPAARFRCVICVAQNGKVLHSVEGKVEGYISRQEKGQGGFGYDPIFIPEQYAAQEKSFAEISAAEKNKISHRAMALKALLEVL